jgi:hypothetical protein
MKCQKVGEDRTQNRKESYCGRSLASDRISAKNAWPRAGGGASTEPVTRKSLIPCSIHRIPSAVSLPIPHMKKSALVVPHISNCLVVRHNTNFLCLLYRRDPFLTPEKRGHFLLIVVNIQTSLPSLVGHFSTGVTGHFHPVGPAATSERFGRKVFSVEGDHGA